MFQVWEKKFSKSSEEEACPYSHDWLAKHLSICLENVYRFSVISGPIGRHLKLNTCMCLLLWQNSILVAKLAAAVYGRKVRSGHSLGRMRAISHLWRVRVAESLTLSPWAFAIRRTPISHIHSSLRLLLLKIISGSESSFHSVWSA